MELAVVSEWFAVHLFDDELADRRVLAEKNRDGAEVDQLQS